MFLSCYGLPSEGISSFYIAWYPITFIHLPMFDIVVKPLKNSSSVVRNFEYLQRYGKCSLPFRSLNCCWISPMLSCLPNFLLAAPSYRTSVIVSVGLAASRLAFSFPRSREFGSFFVCSCVLAFPVKFSRALVSSFVFPSESPRSGASFLRFSTSFFFSSENKPSFPFFLSLNSCSFSSRMV